MGPEASAWGATAPSSCPGPGYSPVSPVPKPRPCPTPPTQELELTCGTALAACPLPAMEQPGLPTWRQWFSWGPCLPSQWSASRSPSPSAARLSAQSPLGPQPPGRTVLPSWIVYVLVLAPSQATGLLQVWDLSAGVCRAPSASHPSDWTVRGPGLLVWVPGAMCGRRAGGEALTW